MKNLPHQPQRQGLARRLSALTRATTLTAALATWSATAMAQAQTIAPPQNVVQLSASATLELPNDWMTVTLSTTQEGPDAQQVQAQLQSLLDSALRTARAVVQTDALQVRTGSFGVTPRFGRDGQPLHWQGSTELILEGRDFDRISRLAGQIQGLTVARVGYGLSRTAKAQSEKQVQMQAIERFKTRATEIAHAFGFNSYTLRDINIQYAEQGPAPRPYAVALDARSSGNTAALPVEAGKGSLHISVQGSIQMK